MIKSSNLIDPVCFCLFSKNSKNRKNSRKNRNSHDHQKKCDLDTQCVIDVIRVTKFLTYIYCYKIIIYLFWFYFLEFHYFCDFLRKNGSKFAIFPKIQKYFSRLLSLGLLNVDFFSVTFCFSVA